MCDYLKIAQNRLGDFLCGEGGCPLNSTEDNLVV